MRSYFLAIGLDGVHPNGKRGLFVEHPEELERLVLPVVIGN